MAANTCIVCGDTLALRDLATALPCGCAGACYPALEALLYAHGGAAPCPVCGAGIDRKSVV